MKGDYHRYLAEFMTGSERKESVENTPNAYKSAQGWRHKKFIHYATVLLNRQGVNVKGILKAETPKEEPQPYIDCSGNLQVWRVNGRKKTRLSASNQLKFYSGDCYIFQYSYPVEEKEDHLIGTCIGKQSAEMNVERNWKWCFCFAKSGSTTRFIQRSKICWN